MLDKFFHGIMFGLGFSIAFTVCLGIGISFFILPNISGEPISVTSSTASIDNTPFKLNEYDKVSESLDFWELSVDEKISNATAIMVTEYQQQEDGRFAAIVTEIAKLDDGVELYYSIGDEYASGSYYPSDDHDRGEGQVIFMLGNPAEMRYSTTYRSERITGLSDIPLRLFREKCDQLSTQCQV